MADQLDPTEAVARVQDAREWLAQERAGRIERDLGVSSPSPVEDHVADLLAEIQRMQSTIEGRPEAPTDAEIAAHGGAWLVQWSPRSWCFADGEITLREMRERQWGRAIRWVPYRDGRPCPWPEVRNER